MSSPTSPRPSPPPGAEREGSAAVGARSRLSIGLIAAALVLAADQVSKWWVLNGLDLPLRGHVRLLPVLDFTLVWNRGVTFGILNGSQAAWSGLALAAVALVVVAALFLWLRRTTSVVTAIAIGAIAGGAIGNVMDRLRHGAVVDFIHAHVGQWSWYVFNVGDAAIVCGVIALLIQSQFGGVSKPNDRGHVSGDLPDTPPHG